MDGRRATVFLSFHRAGEVPAFAAFAERVAADAEAAPGFLGWQHSTLTSPLLEWAIAVTFQDESRAHHWLDRARDVLTGHGYQRASLELFVDGAPRTPGVLLVRDALAPAQEAGFIQSAEHLAQVERVQPGYEGSSIFPPGGAVPDSWSTVIRFRTDDHLNAWLSSPDRARALPVRQAHLSTESQVITASSFGSTARMSEGKVAVTPEWKTAMTIQLVLYPLVLLLALFVNPWLAKLAPQPWLSMFLSLAITIVLLTWVVMPAATRALGRWLDPVEGARPKANLLGIGAVLAGYALILLIFGTVPFLQLPH